MENLNFANEYTVSDLPDIDDELTETPQTIGEDCPLCDGRGCDDCSGTGAMSRPGDAPFVIDSCDRADWYLRKVANLDAERARVKAQAAAMIAQIDSDAARLSHLFAAQLETFARAELERRGGRRKTLPLFQGTLCFRAAAARLSVAGQLDEPEVIDAARTADALRFGVDRGAYMKAAERHFQDTGELLPGIERTEAKESFSVSFAKGKGEAETLA